MATVRHDGVVLDISGRPVGTMGDDGNVKPIPGGVTVRSNWGPQTGPVESPDIVDRIRTMQGQASRGRPVASMAQNDAMTTWEPTGEVIPISEYNRRQEAFGRATKESRIGGAADDEQVQSPQGQVPWWVAQERRQGALTTPVPLSATLPAPGAGLAAQQRTGQSRKDRPLPSAPQGVAWKDMGNYTVWEPTGEVVTIDEYNRRQVAAGRATKETWASGDPNELEDTPHGRVPKWLRYERSTGAYTSPARLSDILPAPGAAAAQSQRDAAGARPKARMLNEGAGAGFPGSDAAAPQTAEEKRQLVEQRARHLRQQGRNPRVRPGRIVGDAERLQAARDLGIDPAEIGILPGEEQVTTQDTFLMLPPDVRMDLRTAHVKGGHADTMDFNDWLSENFSELPPQQRIAAMREVANRRPAPMVVGQEAPAAPEVAAAPAPKRQLTAEQQARIDARRQEQYAREVGNRYAGMLTADEEQAIDSAATAPGGMDFLRRLNADLQRRYQRDRHAQVRDRATNYNLSQDLRSPNYAPGMGVRSLIEAVRSGNSEMAGAVYDIYGNPVAGGQSRQLAGVRARAAADQQAAQIEADNALQVAAMRSAGSGDKEDPLKMDVLANEMDRALANPDPVRRSQAVKTVIAMNPLFTGKDDGVIQAETDRVIASHMARSGTPQGRQHALKYLDSLKGNKDRYISFAVDSLGMPPKAAEQMYNSVAEVGFLGGIERAFSGK